MSANHAIEDIYPLSPLQQGLLFHSLYQPEAGLYLIQLHCRLVGKLERAAFQAAWERVLQQHAVLRSAFIWEEGSEPLQVVLRRAAAPFEYQDWQALPAAEQEARWQDFLAADRQRGFDPGQAPLTRLALVRLAEQRYAFLWTHHHLLLDGWCLSPLLGEVFAAYQALCRGGEPVFAYRRPYRDYIAWLKSQDLAAAEAFWRERLAGFAAPTPLAILAMDQPAMAAAGSEAAELAFQLSESDSAALQAWCKQRQLTLSTVMQGAWALLLAQVSGQGDVLFGVTVAGRPAELRGVEDMVGLFINSLPLRVAVDPALPLLDWLHDLQEESLAVRRYEYAPLAKIQEWSAVPRGAALFHTLLSFENYPVDQALAAGAGDLAVAAVHFVEKTHYPLTAIVAPGERLEIKLLFDAARLGESAVRRCAEHLQGLLREMPAAARLGDLSLLAAWPGKLERQLPPQPQAAARPARRFVAPSTPAEQSLARIWAEVLGLPRVGVEDGFFELGGDSIQAIQVTGLARQNGIAITPRQLFELQTIAQLARLAGTATEQPQQQGPLQGEVALTPIQHWFFERKLPNPHHWNQSLLLQAQAPVQPSNSHFDGKVTGSMVCTDLAMEKMPVFPAGNAGNHGQGWCWSVQPAPFLDMDPGEPSLRSPCRGDGFSGQNENCCLQPEPLEQALQALLAQHDALRLRFSLQGGAWRQRYGEMSAGPLLVEEDLSAADAAELPTVLSARAAQWQRGLHIGDGPLLQAVLFHCGAGRAARLLLVAHHLVVDGVSWRVLLEDLHTAYSQALAGRPIALPVKSTSLQHWSQCLQDYAASEALRRDAAYWTALPWPAAAALPVDAAGGGNAEKHAATVSAGLSEAETRLLLQALPQVFAVEVQAVLLASLAASLAAWTGSDAVLIELEGHGREDLFDGVDLSRTVGWFTSSFPLLLRLPAGATPAACLAAVAEQWRQVPQRGLPYGVARYLARLEGFAAQPKPQVAFNYLGQLDGAGQSSALFSLAPEAVSGVYDANAPRSAELEVSGQIQQGRLELAWTYSSERYRRATIEALLERQLDMLRDLLRHSAAAQGEAMLAVPGWPLGWQADMVLDPAIAPAPGAAAAGLERAACFLTGTTGFVGTFLLEELLRQTGATVYCLVRAAGSDAAFGKIRAQRQRYRLPADLPIERVVPVCGDLALPRFGLSEAAFDDLADRVDSIYHVGAATNLLQPYSTLRAANVAGTLDVLRLACRGRLKPLHYTSTLSVFSHHSDSGPGEISEQSIPQPDPAISMGYAQTKLVAERLLRSAAQRGVPVAIYRLGTVTGHSRSGAWNPDDFYCRMLRTCAELGLAPEPDDLIDMTPVDFVCQAVVRLSGSAQVPGRTFHLQNPAPIAMERLADLLEGIGRPMRQLSYPAWVQQLTASAGFSAEHVLYPFLPYFQENAKAPEGDGEKHALRFICRETTEYLTRQGIACPAIDERLLRVYFEYLDCLSSVVVGEVFKCWPMPLS